MHTHTQEIRRRFLAYFRKQGHSVISSSPVVPHDDPTLLFINAGMNQFKDIFLGEGARDYVRATSAQKCVRVGGKHNDLENVGHTSRHLTLFEMLGNFSFGDYFKKEAIRFAWEASLEVFDFDPNRLWPTVFREDDEAFELWTAYVPAERIRRFDEKDNFWAMGDTGPCGPCSELHYDRGPEYGDAPSPSEDTSGERYYEYWNLVFMQYNRDIEGAINPLPSPSIDTGAGLERIVALKMNADSLFETDVLRGLISEVENLSGIPYNLNDTDKAPAFRVIADHIRCLAFACADGAQPSNVERGYVLRKVLRRAVRYGRMLGLDKPFMAQVLPRLVDSMGEDYPEIVSAQSRIAEILTLEEESFLRTLRRGGNLLSKVIDQAKTHSNQISGDDAFKLKDTYGLPLEEIQLIAVDADLKVDIERYEILEKEARERSRASRKTEDQVATESLFARFAEEYGETAFTGYRETKTEGTVTGIIVDGEVVDKLIAGQEGIILLNQSPFYAEMGGQVGDTGVLTNTHATFTVTDCQPPFKGIIAHIGKLESGELGVEDQVAAEIHADRRKKIANNHTATHLLHWALCQVVGDHIKQAGSAVDDKRIRFDFNHHKALSTEQVREIEDLVNTRIRENYIVQAYEIPYDDAQKRSDIKMYFGEKYGSTVRVIDIDFCKELCGGTHTTAVGNIGFFRIAKESSIAAGIRRIEATTGPEAELLARESEDRLETLAILVKTHPNKLENRLKKLLEENKHLQQSLKATQKSQQQQQIDVIINQKETIGQITLIATKISLPPKELRPFAEQIMESLGSGILVLAAADEDKCQLITRVSDDIISRGIKAVDIIKAIAPTVDGKGGGKPDAAQAGGKNPEGIEDALQAAKQFIAEQEALRS